MEVWFEAGQPEEPTRGELTGADLMDLRAEPGLFAALAGWRAAEVAYVGLSTQEVLEAAEVTAGMFGGVLRVQPFLGRTFLPEEDRPDAAPTVLLSHAFWSEHFGEDPGVIGRSVVLDGTPQVVVGVMPPGRRPPFQPGAEVWTTARLQPQRCRNGCPSVSAVGRLASGTRLEVARDRASALGHRLAESYPDTNRNLRPALAPLGQARIGVSSRTTRLLLSGGALVFLLSCSNVALLLLARGVDRRREMVVRRSVGATRGSVVGQVLVESVALASVGAVLGVGVAVWVLEALERPAPAELLSGVALELDLVVLGGVALLTVGAGVVFGVVPAVVGAGAGSISGRAQKPGSVALLRTTRFLRGALGAVQIGLATVIVIGAGGLLRSLHEATGDALGFDPANVLTVQVGLASSPFSTPAERAGRVALVTERLAAVPGVFSVAADGSLPFEETLSATVNVRAVSPAYFYTLRQRLSEGRWFRPEDDETSAPVAMISSTAARALFADPPRSPVGEAIAVGADVPVGDELTLPKDAPAWKTVVGVVRDEWGDSEARASEAVVYVPIAQAVPEEVHLVVRVDGDPLEAGSRIRTALGEMESGWKAGVVVPLNDRVQDAYSGERFGAVLAAAFAALALVISLVGLFGVLAHAATTRVREWGLRRAVGATDGEIRGSVVARGAALAVVGVILGGVSAGLFAEGLDAVFAGVGLRTPIVYAGTVTLLTAAVLMASAWPARRSVAVDVVSALRAD